VESDEIGKQVLGTVDGVVSGRVVSLVGLLCTGLLITGYSYLERETRELRKLEEQIYRLESAQARDDVFRGQGARVTQADLERVLSRIQRNERDIAKLSGH